MRLASLRVLACPRCLGPLKSASPALEVLEDGTLLCTQEGLRFPVVGGVPHLVRPERAKELEEFARSYSRTWHQDGWGCGEKEYLLNLPFRDITRRQSAKWRVKARSLAVLLEVLKKIGAERVIDLGSGMCWLSYHLARHGYEVFAIDAVKDDILGLGAGRIYLEAGPYFERIWAEIERPPFGLESVDAVVCNASLHYASELHETLLEVNRILRPGGSMIILNSPVHHDLRSARRAESDFRNRLRRMGASDLVISRYHHFHLPSLESAIRQIIGPVEAVPFDPGRIFRCVRYIKGKALGIELASFPILLATKPEE